jgi:lipoprotein NlpI
MLSLLAGLALFYFQQSWQQFNQNGETAFRAAKIDESIKLFDQAIAAEPRLAPHHWQRGIALYYAGRFDDCRKQFELHQTVNSEDVENSVWHFLCASRLKGPAEARKSLIEIHSDTRVPMMEVYAMFRGASTPEKVLAKAGNSRDGLFYSHLYIALLHEAEGRPKESLKSLRKAVDEFGADHYMGDVARVHLKLRTASPQTSQPK